MTQHPDLHEEQAYIDHAYECLERSRSDAWRLRGLTEVGAGGTHAARYERDVLEEALQTRLSQLELHDHALVFGRIDRFAHDEDTNGDVTPTNGDATNGDETALESFHIGRLAVADEHRDPVVIDWRAPVAEPFYRATGRNPMGLARRRHFSLTGRRVIGIEDELFGAGHLGVGDEAFGGLAGYSTLLAALEAGRTGLLGDIVATIQAEQDEIIRSPQAGVLVVQGGPGTGKTVVALHRAAYLLYTYRFPLEDQGVLVVGPNRLFLRYIERVLPSLGEAGIDQVVLSDLVNDVRFGATDDATVTKVKGDARMAAVIAKAVRDRERPLREDVLVPFGTQYLRLRVSDSERIVQAARRRYRRHNAARRFVENEVYGALAASSRDPLSTDLVRERARNSEETRELLERIWPVLTPAQLLRDLFGSKPLLKLAAAKRLSEDEYLALHRDRQAVLAEVRWSAADAPLLDEARALLGPRPRAGKINDEDEIRTYGHVIIDEVQDLSPMELRMASRRSLNGSMTIVGDIAQATGQHAPHDWSDVLRHLPDRRPSRVVELTVGYRIPEQIMVLASRVLRAAAPGLVVPVAVRRGEIGPRIERVDTDQIGAMTAALTEELRRDVGDGNVAVIVPNSLVDVIGAGLEAAGVSFGYAARRGLEEPVTLVPIDLVKGLEMDAVVVVEPARIVSEQTQGLRALYVALTRSTKRLSVVHAQPLPEALVG
jgi:DNA helicase IV